MSEINAAKKSVSAQASAKSVENAREKLEKVQEDLAEQVANDKKDAAISIRSGSGLKTLRISAPADEKEEGREAAFRAPRRNDVNAAELFEMDNEPVLMLSPSNKKPLRIKASHTVIHVTGLFLTALWIGLCAAYVTNDVGWGTLASQQPHLMGGFIAGMLAPIALLWMMLSFLQRGSDVHMYADALRGELQSLLFPSEERGQVIHKDIEELVRQAAELSTASKAVLKSIHKARMGLRAEIQGMNGISKKTEFHIDRLAETLSERSSKLLSLTEEIEQRTGAIDEKTLAGAEAWDQAALTVLERAAEMEAAIGKGATKLLDAADAAKGRTDGIAKGLEDGYEGLRRTVDEIATKLEKLSGDFDTHKKDLSGATAQVSEETARLGEALQGQIKDLEDMTKRTVDSMTRAGETIQENREALDQGAKDLATEAESIAERLNSGVGVIQNAVDDISTKTENLETRLEERAAKLREAIDGIDTKVSAIDNIGTQTANKLSEGMSVALSGAESISSAVRRAIESLSRATDDAQKQAENMITTTKVNIDQLNEAGAGNIEHVENIVKMLEKSREQIQAASSMADEQVNKLSASVEEQVEKINVAQATLTERIENVREALSSPLQAVTRAVTDADIKHDAIATTLTRRVKDLTDASDKATENAGKIRDLLRSQAQEISILAGQIAGHSRTITEQMGTQKDDLGRQVTESLERIESVRAALEDQAGRLSGLSHTAQDDITRLNGSISTSCEEISRSTQTTITDLTSLEDRLSGRILALRDESGKARDAMESVAESMQRTASGIEPVYIKAVNQATTARERLEALRTDFDDTTHSNLSRLSEIGNIFDERLNKLKEGADQASTILVTSADHLRDRVDDIESAAASASDKMRTIESTLNNQASDIHLATDQALLKIEAVQKAIAEQFQDLTISVGQSVAQMKDAGEEFIRQANHAETAAEDAAQRFDLAGEKALEEGRKLKQSGDDAVNFGRDLVASVQREAEQLLKSSEATLLELKKAGDSFALRAREVSEQMKVSLVTSREYGNELSVQADSVAEAGNRAADTVSRAVSVMATKLGDVDGMAKDVSTRIETVRERLSEEAERLVVVSTKALKASEEASSTFSRQSNAMFKAAQDATRQIETIRDAEWKAKREAFMSSAKFVVESLHSLSVDVTRMLEGEIQEKTWKSYQKGDIPAFTRRLVEMGDRLPMDKIRDKYTSDSEFRNYVSRFVRQFEEVYDQALGNDHGDLLGSTFFSSDVGKLYQILCATTGREPRRSKDAAVRKTA